MHVWNGTTMDPKAGCIHSDAKGHMPQPCGSIGIPLQGLPVCDQHIWSYLLTHTTSNLPLAYTGIALTYTDVTLKLHRLSLTYLHTSPPTLHRYPLKLHRLPPIHTSLLNSKDIASNLHITLSYTCAAITSLHTYTSWSCGSPKQRADMAWR